MLTFSEEARNTGHFRSLFGKIQTRKNRKPQAAKVDRETERNKDGSQKNDFKRGGMYGQLLRYVKAGAGIVSAAGNECR